MRESDVLYNCNIMQCLHVFITPSRTRVTHATLRRKKHSGVQFIKLAVKAQPAQGCVVLDSFPHFHRKVMYADLIVFQNTQCLEVCVARQRVGEGLKEWAKAFIPQFTVRQRQVDESRWNGNQPAERVAHNLPVLCGNVVEVEFKLLKRPVSDDSINDGYASRKHVPKPHVSKIQRRQLFVGSQRVSKCDPARFVEKWHNVIGKTVRSVAGKEECSQRQRATAAPFRA